MNSLRMRTTVPLVFLVATCISLASLVQMNPGSATVRAVRGKAEWQSVAGLQAVPLKVNQVLHPGARISTGPNSVVDLHLRQNGPMVRLLPNSALTLTKLLYQGKDENLVIETELTLEKGRALAAVKKLNQNSSYRIRTRTNVIGIRGTEFDVNEDGTVHCLSGSLVVLPQPGGHGPADFQVDAGQSFLPSGKERAHSQVVATSGDQTTESLALLRSIDADQL